MARRKAKEATAAYLERVALWYLARYPGSVARVRQALDKRVARSVEELGTSPEAGAQAAEEVIAGLLRTGLLDDERFATQRVAALRARGLSKRMIESKLRQQGIAATVVVRAVEDAEVDELSAARTFARKRRPGPHRRRAPEDAEAARQLRDKELAKLARAGFSFGFARRVLDED